MFTEEFTKKIIYRGNCLKRWALTVDRFKKGLGQKEEVVFLLGVDYTMHIMKPNCKTVTASRRRYNSLIFLRFLFI